MVFTEVHRHIYIFALMVECGTCEWRDMGSIHGRSSGRNLIPELICPTLILVMEEIYQFYLWVWVTASKRLAHSHSAKGVGGTGRVPSVSLTYCLSLRFKLKEISHLNKKYLYICIRTRWKEKLLWLCVGYPAAWPHAVKVRSRLSATGRETCWHCQTWARSSTARSTSEVVGAEGYFYIIFSCFGLHFQNNSLYYRALLLFWGENVYNVEIIFSTCVISVHTVHTKAKAEELAGKVRPVERATLSGSRKPRILKHFRENSTMEQHAHLF